MGSRFIVENKAGAGGITGTLSAAKANADGYTFLLTASGPAVYNKLLYKSIQYDTEKDFYAGRHYQRRTAGANDAG